MVRRSVLLIALPMLALTYAIFSDALAPTLPSLRSRSRSCRS